jgi:hypothetical protein
MTFTPAVRQAKAAANVTGTRGHRFQNVSLPSTRTSSSTPELQRPRRRTGAAGAAARASPSCLAHSDCCALTAEPLPSTDSASTLTERVARSDGHRSRFCPLRFAHRRRERRVRLTKRSHPRSGAKRVERSLRSSASARPSTACVELSGGSVGAWHRPL